MKLQSLWFLPVILIIVVMAYPSIRFIKRRSLRIDLDFEDVKLLMGITLACWIWNYVSY